MKSKFQNFDFGSVEVLSRDEQNKVKGGYIPNTGGGLYPYTPPYGGAPTGPGGLPSGTHCRHGMPAQSLSESDCMATYGTDCGVTISWSGNCNTL
jgi:hypothetical protein